MKHKIGNLKKIILITIIILLTGSIMLVGGCLSVQPYESAYSDHFDGTRFHNYDKTEQEGSLFKVFLTEKKGHWEEVQNKPNPPLPAKRVSNGRVIITFVNHSTFLIQTDGVNILTDPVWSDRVSPFSWAGPKRYRQPGIAIKDLPRIDIILISHNHYDHMDISTLKILTAKHNPKIYVPLGNSSFLMDEEIANSTDLDWWQEIRFNKNISIACVPAKHFSNRGLFDKNRTLWSGFIIKSSKGNIYFAGDTAYDSFFKTIGKRYKPIIVSLLPIGAYKPVWFMKHVHSSPKEAVIMHQDLKSARSIACHYSTFPLGWDAMEDPINDLKTALNNNKLSSNEFLLLHEGHGIDLLRNNKNSIAANNNNR